MAARKTANDEVPADAEERLLVQAAQRDPARFGDLYEMHFARIYAFITRRVGDRSTAEDLTSEVFHRALAHLRNYEWRGAPFGAWLIRIASDLVADHGKLSAREALAVETGMEPSTTQPDLEAIENQALLFRMVKQLPTDQRRVIFDRFVEWKSVREIARQLGKTEGAVKQLQFRALQNLRAQMEGTDA